MFLPSQTDLIARANVTCGENIFAPTMSAIDAFVQSAGPGRRISADTAFHEDRCWEVVAGSAAARVSLCDACTRPFVGADADAAIRWTVGCCGVALHRHCFSGLLKQPDRIDLRERGIFAVVTLANAGAGGEVDGVSVESQPRSLFDSALAGADVVAHIAASGRLLASWRNRLFICRDDDDHIEQRWQLPGKLVCVAASDTVVVTQRADVNRPAFLHVWSSSGQLHFAVPTRRRLNQERVCRLRVHFADGALLYCSCESGHVHVLNTATDEYVQNWPVLDKPHSWMSIRRLFIFTYREAVSGRIERGLGVVFHGALHFFSLPKWRPLGWVRVPINRSRFVPHAVMDSRVVYISTVSTITAYGSTIDGDGQLVSLGSHTASAPIVRMLFVRKETITHGETIVRYHLLLSHSDAAPSMVPASEQQPLPVQAANGVSSASIQSAISSAAAPQLLCMAMHPSRKRMYAVSEYGRVLVGDIEPGGTLRGKWRDIFGDRPMAPQFNYMLEGVYTCQCECSQDSLFILIGDRLIRTTLDSLTVSEYFNDGIHSMVYLAATDELLTVSVSRKTLQYRIISLRPAADVSGGSASAASNDAIGVAIKKREIIVPLADEARCVHAVRVDRSGSVSQSRVLLFFNFYNASGYQCVIFERGVNGSDTRLSRAPLDEIPAVGQVFSGDRCYAAKDARIHCLALRLQQIRATLSLSVRCIEQLALSADESHLLVLADGALQPPVPISDEQPLPTADSLILPGASSLSSSAASARSVAAFLASSDELPGGEDDVNLLSKVLRKLGVSRRCRFPCADYNTRADVLRGLDRFLHAAALESCRGVIVYFSGHGRGPPASTASSAATAARTDQDEAKRGIGDWIVDNTKTAKESVALEDIVGACIRYDALRQGTVLIVADCCHSGAWCQRLKADKRMRDWTKVGRVAVLSSCAAHEKSPAIDIPGVASPFTAELASSGAPPVRQRTAAAMEPPTPTEASWPLL